MSRRSSHPLGADDEDDYKTMDHFRNITLQRRTTTTTYYIPTPITPLTIMATLGLINYRGGQTAVSHLISGVDQESRRSSRMFRGKKGNLAFYYGQGEVQVVVWPLLNAMGEESERKTSLAKH